MPYETLNQNSRVHEKLPNCVSGSERPEGLTRKGARIWAALYPTWKARHENKEPGASLQGTPTGALTSHKNYAEQCKRQNVNQMSCNCGLFAERPAKKETPMSRKPHLGKRPANAPPQRTRNTSKQRRHLWDSNPRGETPSA